MTSREQIRQQAIREAIARVQSGEWTLSARQKAQVRAIQKADARERAAGAPLHEALRHGLRTLLDQPLPSTARAIVDKLLALLASHERPREDQTTAEVVKGLKAEVKAVRKTAQLIEKSRGSRPATRKQVADKLMREIKGATEERRPADGVRGPGRPRNEDTDPATLAAQKLTRKIREGVKKRRGIRGGR